MRTRYLSATTIVSLCFFLFAAKPTNSQTTEFTYQGSLALSGVPANGSYDFDFLLFDAVTGGAQLGATISVAGVPVADGIFSVRLNFGNQFPGANRYLEVRVRPTGQPGMTILSPRHQLSSSPYSVRSFTSDSAATANLANNALNLGGVAANQFVLTTDPRMSDARPPTSGSPSYIQNATSPQTGANFNISGTGSANIVNAALQYNIAGIRILGTPGSFNLFVGTGAGGSLSTGSGNAFFGFAAGNGNSTGSNNTAVGANTNVGANNLSFATAIGAQAVVQASNTILLGRNSGEDRVQIPGFVILETLSTGGSQALCRNAFLLLATCSSSARYKFNIRDFRTGLDLLKRLRPVAFNWRDGGASDIGLVAEEVARVEPLLTTTNANGEVEGVKYDRLSVVLMNSVNEQQARIDDLERQVVELRRLFCTRRSVRSKACPSRAR